MKSDLISRNALIDSLWSARDYNDSFAYRHALLAIAEAPTIDAVPVVRCKDCEKHQTEDCPMCEWVDWWDDDNGWSRMINIDRTHDDGFCDLGVKMEGERNYENA